MEHNVPWRIVKVFSWTRNLVGKSRCSARFHQLSSSRDGWASSGSEFAPVCHQVRGMHPCSERSLRDGVSIAMRVSRETLSHFQSFTRTTHLYISLHFSFCSTIPQRTRAAAISLKHQSKVYTQTAVRLACRIEGIVTGDVRHAA